jgi:BlaI family transcriptional regulator, penicillinase repressor
MDVRLDPRVTPLRETGTMPASKGPEQQSTGDSMAKPVHLHLSRRERQIMDIVFALGEASVSEVVARMPDEPGYNTVRNTMGILERKGHLNHRKDGHRYLYRPIESVEVARRSAVHHLLETFFHGSLPAAVVAMLGNRGRKLSKEELDEIAEIIESVRNEME